MIQINNTNTAQTIYLKLDGYSSTSTSVTLDIAFTSQLTSRVFNFEAVAVLTTNGRYQSMDVTPPAETAPTPTNATMEEGMYLVTFTTTDTSTLLATRLSFVSDVPVFKESTYDAYTVGDTTAYEVYTK